MTVPIIIAHRGASGYLPEHSRGAKALACGMGADYLEQDVIATRDGELIVLHDLVLDAVSDVREKFSGRERADGQFYCYDFDLAELRTLTFHERINPQTGRAVYPDRYPPTIGRFQISTLAEEMLFLAEMNCATGRTIGLYPEIKDPEWHAQQGFDLGNAVIDELERGGYLTGEPKIFLQCFDPQTLIAARARVGADLPMIQLVSRRTRIDTAMLDDIAGYANGIGPSLKLIYSGRGEHGEPVVTDLVAEAHERGLEVHPYTFRVDDLPAGFESFESLLDLFIDRLAVDGVFTDFTDRVARYLEGDQSRPQ